MENSDCTEPTIEDLTADLERKRQSIGATRDELLGDIAKRRQIEVSPPKFTAEQIAARDAENAERERERQRERELKARHDRWRTFIDDRGPRYAGCRLENFDTSLPKQAATIEALKAYSASLVQRILAGEGLVLFGPKGTGKDHLLVALAHQAIGQGFTVEWQNGMDLFGDMRDRMDPSKSTDSDKSERALVKRLVSADVLYLSDPVPPAGILTDFQTGTLFRIFDGRYARKKPIWCSINATSGAELEQRMGAQTVDRLRDGALSILCDWPSWRKVSDGWKDWQPDPPNAQRPLQRPVNTFTMPARSHD